MHHRTMFSMSRQSLHAVVNADGHRAPRMLSTGCGQCTARAQHAGSAPVRAAVRVTHARAMTCTVRRRSSFMSSVVRIPTCFPLVSNSYLHMRQTGYYPPNHQLVIGTDPLDSFEELAELLGQAKPQTASKEDIDNSGLEVIRMGALPEYEKSGRVAPMCVDRVRLFFLFAMRVFDLWLS